MSGQSRFSVDDKMPTLGMPCAGGGRVGGLLSPWNMVERGPARRSPARARRASGDAGPAPRGMAAGQPRRSAGGKA